MSWLDDPALARIWGVLRERLEARGLRAEGRVVLTELTREERHAASALVGRPVTTARLPVDLARLDAELAARWGEGGLLAAVEQATGAPLRNRRALRAERLAAREAPLELARRLLDGEAWADEWLRDIRRSGLLARASDPEAAVRAAAAALRRLPDPVDVSHPDRTGAALRRLPAPAGVSRTDLATAVAGNAHALDEGRTAAALILRALAARAGEPVPATTAARRDLWERAGVRVDLVSTTCLTVGLTATAGHGRADDDADPRDAGAGVGHDPDPGSTGAGEDGRRAPLGAGPTARRVNLAAEAGDPLHLTAWDLRRCSLRVPPVVLVCENPRVLEAIAERGAPIPVVCTSGRPTLVVLDVLSALHGAELRYHGDFDWPGIAIANRLVAEAGVAPWLMGASDYERGLTGARLQLAGTPVDPVWDGELGAAMRHHGLAIHEEAVLPRILAAL